MIFTIGTHEIRTEVTNEERFTSPHTGAQLRRIDVIIQGRERDHQLVMDLHAEAQRHGMASSEPDGRSAQWSAKQNSYSYSNDSSLRTYRWSLEEKEELRIETLVLDELELNPYQYEEEIEDGALMIKARFTLSSHELDAVHALMRGGDYFQVVRKGINPEPKTMRMGRGLWSQDGDVHKQELILVDKEIDSRKESSGRGSLERFHIGTRNIKGLLPEKGAALEELIEILSEKGVLTVSDRERIEKAIPERSWHLQMQFERVRDLDEWSM